MNIVSIMRRFYHQTDKRNSGVTSITLCVLLQLSTVAHAGDLPTCTPEDVGLSTVKLKYLDQAVLATIDRGQVAGVVTLVARHGKVAQFKAYGKMSLETGEPMRKDALFRIYSMTKPITSVATLKLYEKGYFQLNDPVEMYVPAFKGIKVYNGLDNKGNMILVEQHRKVTILDMFRHTSGLSYGMFSDTPIDKAYRDADIRYLKEPLADMIKRLAKVPLLYQPGTKWHYGYSYDVLADIVESLSGMTYGEYLKKEIFIPLGMKDTSFGVPKDKLPRLTTLYGPPGENSTEKKLRVLETPDHSEYLAAEKFQAGGAGLVSTVEDYYRFAQMLLNKGEYNGNRILGRKTVELLSSNQLPPELMPFRPGVGFGLGVPVVVDPAATGSLCSKGQYEESGFATTIVIIDPAEDMVAIYMAQFLPANQRLTEQFKTLVYQAIIR